MNLTDKDRDLAKRYIICRSAIKALLKDKEKLTQVDFELDKIYLKITEEALVRANDELRQLLKNPISVKTTGQPTVYEVSIGKRLGYVEINVLEIKEGIRKIFLDKLSDD